MMFIKYFKIKFNIIERYLFQRIKFFIGFGYFNNNILFGFLKGVNFLMNEGFFEYCFFFYCVRG